jgi:hypothetical protein
MSTFVLDPAGVAPGARRFDPTGSVERTECQSPPLTRRASRYAASLSLLVTYHRPQDIVRDYDQQLVRGGLLVRVPPPAGLDLYGEVELRIAALGVELALSAQLVQVFPGVGVAVTFDPALLAGLAAAVEQARAEGEREGAAVEHTAGAGPAPLAPDGSAIAAATPERSSGAAATARIQQALHGSRDERAAILRDVTAKSVHAYVLRNPNLQLDEVVAMAKNAGLAPDLLRQISERREWTGRPEIALALVRNPKTLVPIAIRLLDSVTSADLRQIAKDGHTRAPIAQAARKKLGS